MFINSSLLGPKGLLGLYGDHCGRPGPLGSPFFAKFVQ